MHHPLQNKQRPELEDVVYVKVNALQGGPPTSCN